MRPKLNLLLIALAVPALLLLPAPAEAGCSTTCSNGSSSSDLGGCECCCQSGDAVCDAKGGKCSTQVETLQLNAPPEELADYRLFIHRLQDSRNPQLRALASEAQAIYDAVVFQDPTRHVEATKRYLESRQRLSPAAIDELLSARKPLGDRGFVLRD